MAFIKTITDSDSNIIYPATEASAVFISGGGSSYTTLSSAMASINSKLDNFDNESQVESLPTASASNVGEIHQYIGTTSGNYIHGYFYECVYDNGTYSWVNRPVQNESTGHTVVNASGTEMAQRSKLQFSTGFITTDDSTNDKTVIEVDSYTEWSGTQSQYNAATQAGTIDEGTIVTINDAPFPVGVGGHTIINSSGISMTARSGLQFSTGFTSTDDSTNDKTIITINAMSGASSVLDGTVGMVPAPSAGDDKKFLKGDGTWSDVASAKIDINPSSATISSYPVGTMYLVTQ